jgi:transcriptional regulator with XRE-family HTH domain
VASRNMLRDRKAFAQWLRECLAAHRMSQSEFERELNFAQGMSSHWVNANRSPSPRTIRKIAQFFGVDDDYLLTLAGYRLADEHISDENDPRLHMIAKIKLIEWDDRTVRFVTNLLDDLLNEGRGKDDAPTFLATTSGRKVLANSLN